MRNPAVNAILWLQVITATTGCSSVWSAASASRLTRASPDTCTSVTGRSSRASPRPRDKWRSAPAPYPSHRPLHRCVSVLNGQMTLQVSVDLLLTIFTAFLLCDWKMFYLVGACLFGAKWVAVFAAWPWFCPIFHFGSPPPLFGAAWTYNLERYLNISLKSRSPPPLTMKSSRLVVYSEFPNLSTQCLDVLTSVVPGPKQCIALVLPSRSDNAFYLFVYSLSVRWKWPRMEITCVDCAAGRSPSVRTWGDTSARCTCRVRAKWTSPFSPPSTSTLLNPTKSQVSICCLEFLQALFHVRN